MLICGDVKKDDTVFRIGTTHFTWTPDAAPNQLQREDTTALLNTMKLVGHIVLMGDFNAPRGGEIFSIFANNFKDNVPVQYTSSIDGALHRAGELPHMVDGIFSTEEYIVSNVRMVCGISDHCGLFGMITKQ